MNEYEEMMIERDEAWEKGHAEGLAEGRMEMAMEIAIKLRAKGMAVQEISAVTGLSSEEIASL